MTDITIFTKGSREDGMGHIIREIVLGHKLAELGHDIEYVTYNHTPGALRLREEWNSKPIAVNSVAQTEDAVLKYLQVAQPDIFIIDIEHGPTRGFLQQAKGYVNKVVVVGGVGFVINDQEAIDELVDLQIYQSVTLNEGIYRNESLYATRNALIGPEYVIISEDYLTARQNYGENGSENGNGILISLGGGDPFGLTPVVFAKLRRAFPNERVTRVYGSAAKLPYKPHLLINAHVAPASLASIMAEYRVLITALGMTVYEACCVGIPTICTAWSRDHEDTAIKLEHLNCVVYADIWSKLNYDRMIDATRAFLTKEETWKFHHAQMRATIDGHGADRVAEAICTI